jgi:UDP-glucose 4-epimerase
VRVLITGGAGFIGSHLCDAFLAEGKQVTILDNLSTGSKNNIDHLKDKISLIHGDIRDLKLVDSLVKSSDLVMHMAASLGVNNILNNTVESISVNFHGSEVVLNSALKFDKRIFIASTSEIYGKNPNQPLSETADRVVGNPQKIRWTYSDAKALEEAMAYSLYLTKNLRVTTLRFFNTVGPRQTGKYGMVLPRFVRAAKNNEPLYIYGNGKQSRVFCHVKDSVSAVIKLTKLDNSIGEVFNIGGLEEISILDLARQVIKLTRSKSSLNFVPYSDAYSKGYEDMERRVPDITKIRNFTGWEPRNSLSNIISDIEKSLI